MKTTVTVLLLLLCASVRAQVTLEEMVAAMGIEDEDVMEELAQLHANPIDLNTATAADLMRIPLLSAQQAEDIRSLVFVSGGLRSLSELMAVESLDYEQRQFLPLFVYAGQQVFARQDTTSMRNLMRRATHELTTRLDVPLYYREGYMHSTANGGYHGSPVYSKTQYRLQSGNRVQAGLTMEKDAGEPASKGHYGGYAMIKNVRGIRAAVVGDYKLGFGQGLVINNGLTLSKTTALSMSRGVRAHTSADENNYMRGAALSIGKGGVTTTMWLSARQLDATLSGDSARTIVTTGLHRTDTEIGKRGNLTSVNAGADVTWERGGWTLGGTAYWQHYNRALYPGTADYRRYWPQGSTFGVAGAHYGYRNRWLTIAGETAYSSAHGGVATLNHLTWRTSSTLRLTASGRCYRKEYYSFYASALCENSRVQDESGLMLKADWQPSAQWSVVVYADWWRNPWPLYGMRRTSHGQDVVALVERKLSSRHQLSARLQLKRKESGDTMYTHWRARVRYTLTPTARTRVQSMVNLHAVGGKAGLALTQGIRQSMRRPCALQTTVTYFRTPDYNTRVYVTEPSLRGTFYYPALSGHGFRTAATCQYALWGGRLTAEAKYSLTAYLDRDTQGTGMQTIFSPCKNDISVQLRLRI